MKHQYLTLGSVTVIVGALFACSQTPDTSERSPSAASQAVFYGTPATNAKYGAVGSTLVKAARTGYQEFNCSGTLIAPQVVLTAKHCTQALTFGQYPSVNAYFGIGANADKPDQKIQIRAILNAPPAPPDPVTGKPVGLMGKGGRDIAILYLDEAPKGIIPAKLGKFDPSIMLHTQFEIAGFGRTDQGALGVKYAGNVTARAIQGDWYRLLFNDNWDDFDYFYWNDSVSNWNFDEEALWWAPGTWKLEAGYELVAGGLPGESVSCFGDSGGPLLRGTSAQDLTVYGVSAAVESSYYNVCGYGGAYTVLNDEMLAFVQQAVANAPAVLGK